MSIAVFGPGAIYVTRTDVANSTPVNIGYAQELSVDISFNTKSLYGQNQFPLDVARSVAKTTGKMKAAKVSGIAMNNFIFGNTFATGSLNFNSAEPHQIPGTPYQVTVTNSATFETDLGVVYTTTGLPLIKVASAPAQGQYSVSAGVYTFAAADTLANVLISYSNTVAGTGQKLIVTNPLIGFTPTFQLDYATTHLNLTFWVRIFQAIGSKFSTQFKLEDYMIPEFDFEYFANSSGQVIEYFLSDVG
jgi:hypothetical protein